MGHRANQLLYWVIIGGFFIPLLLGLLGVLLPSFGIDPALGSSKFSLVHWHELLNQSEFWSGLKLSVLTGIMATVLSYWFASSLVVCTYQTRWFQRLQSIITPILSIPHAAITIGALFVLSPSGWLVRMISPWLTQFDRPPNWLTVQDPEGIALIIALVIKETPYLVFAMAAALSQLQPNKTLLTTRLLGYDSITAWHFTLLPQLFKLVRLPVFMVLAFNLTVVDVATIIGPNTPSTLAVTLLRWFNDPSLSLRGQASAAAMILAFSVAACIAIWLLSERCYSLIRKRLSLLGQRRSALRWTTLAGMLGALVILSLTILALFVLPLWAFTRRWRFPDNWPSSFTLDNVFRAGQNLIELSTQSFSLGLCSSLISLGLALVLLECERLRPKQKFAVIIVFSAILLPQITLLFGIQVGLLYLDWNGTWWSVLGLHTLYTLPYVYLTLKAPYLAFDQGYLEQANRLRTTPTKNFWQVKVALLKAPIGAALAIGFSVSMAQYLPTLIAGEGRINTLTTEAVARASSGNRKWVSVLALAQAILPLICFYLATLLPRYWTSWRLTLKRVLC
ncbi:ABC transporter permease [Marinomonas gallaica]|uniref:ABC transporter permease n=1 Tax=Marinomonas gallaica TaxID=1806667 RepID=UPI003A8D69B9